MMLDSYVLRFWRSHSSDNWHATLIGINQDATEQHFSTVEELLAYLNRNYPSPPGLTAVALPPISEEDRSLA